MNNQGWGLKTMIIFCGVLAIAIVISGVLATSIINRALNKNKEKLDYTQAYLNREEAVKVAATTYFKDKNSEYDEFLFINIPVNELIKKDYLEVIKDPQDNTIECSGYVLITYKKALKYDPFIACGDKYTTAGYSSILDY